jgi:hypothetical protein
MLFSLWTTAQSGQATAAGVGGNPTLPGSPEPLLIKRTEDFEVNSSGNHPAWNQTGWNSLSKLDDGGPDYPSQFKILYSVTGIYILFRGEDHTITTSAYKDMDPIWNGDVFELFLHPDPERPVYFEYEVNPLGKQLLLTISDRANGVSWIPFNEYGENRYGTINQTRVFGGVPKQGATISSWVSEVFVSFKSLGLLPGIPPESGSRWKANFCRLDHDTGKMIKWSWTPDIEKSFHELDKFQWVVFE